MSIDFTGYQPHYYDSGAKNKKTVSYWVVRTPFPHCHYKALIPGPEILAESWGSTMSAKDAVLTLFDGSIPYFYHLYADTIDTQIGVDAIFRRMRTPESLYKSRQKRIFESLKKNDPLFFDQLIDDALANDEFDLSFYQRRQKEKQDMIFAESAKNDDLGNLWINPEGCYLKQFNWKEIRKALAVESMRQDCVYDAWDVITKKFGLFEAEIIGRSAVIKRNLTTAKAAQGTE